MWQVFEPELRRRLSQLDATASTADRVRAVLLELLPGNDATIEKTAARLGMSKRTLQRRLENEGEFPLSHQFLPGKSGTPLSVQHQFIRLRNRISAWF